MAHMQAEFSARKTIVEIDTTERRIFCIGDRERDLLASKNMVKNLMESTFITIIRYNSFNSDQIRAQISKASAYASNKSTYPVLLQKLNGQCVCLISKDNITRKLLNKNGFL